MCDASTASECWHSIVLRGRNSATYKMALAWCLIKFVEQGKTRVTWDELAVAFLDLYVERLRNDMPQLSDRNTEAVIEGVVQRYNNGDLARVEAIREVRAKAFNDVIRSFHVVDGAEVPVKFYMADDDGLSLTEDARLVITREGTAYILAEIDQKWSELELAWRKSREGL